MKKLQWTKKAIEADERMRAWQKVAELAKKVDSKKAEQEALSQVTYWEDYFLKKY